MKPPEIEKECQKNGTVFQTIWDVKSTVKKLMRDDGCSRRTASRIVAKRKQRLQSLRERLEASEREFCEVIKPDDNWNFNNPLYIEGKPSGGHGYIPGDLYANCLWYWTKADDIVAAPMAGCGQIQIVYDNRALWMRPEPWEIDLHLFDLTPQHSWITQNDLTKGLPLRRAHYIVLDLPYLHIAAGQYSDKSDDLANMDEGRWSRAVASIALACSKSQKSGDRCTVIATNYRELGRIVLATAIVRDAFIVAGYMLTDLAYASRRIQQTQNVVMARTNKKAKRNRIMLSDMAEVMTFSI